MTRSTSKTKLLSVTQSTNMKILSSDETMICPPFMPLNVLIDLSQMFYNQDKAKSNFQAFQRVFFNSSIPTRLIRNSEQLGDAETDLLFHFDHSTIDRNDIYRKNYKMVVTYEPAFMIRGKNWNDNYSYSADITIYISCVDQMPYLITVMTLR